jgi:hypothetical protein
VVVGFRLPSVRCLLRSLLTLRGLVLMLLLVLLLLQPPRLRGRSPRRPFVSITPRCVEQSVGLFFFNRASSLWSR